jgi:hypothetical protein
MVDKTTAVMDILKDKYQLRVQLSGGESARLIGPVHRIFLTVGRKEQRYHLGDDDLRDLIANIAWEKLGLELDASDMQELKKKLKAVTIETPISATDK